MGGGPMLADPILRPAVAADAAPLAALWATAFTPPLRPDQWLVDAERFAHTIVAVDDEGVIGSIYGLPKRLREDGGAAAAVHCIGSVAVADRARGRGIARRLVAATLEAAEHSGADWVLLFTGTPDVYRSSGFETFAMRRALAGPWRDAAETSDVEVRRSPVSAETLASLAVVYERSRSGVVLAPVRSPQDWAMATVRLDGMTLYRLADGYALAQARDGLGTVAELVAPTDGRTGALLGEIAADWRDAGVLRCDIAIPDRAADLAAVRAFAPAAEWTPDATGMTRPLGRTPRITGIRHFGAADYF
ncbi:GNAT family N-acetyltransferase [Microbacterium sp. NPDC057659]|uniref:GNAT family N-acetyltransferase n=1 Tax=Microbacterium sp. NPDC057659 TaxID=3346198 RepID=UPI00366D43AC